MGDNLECPGCNASVNSSAAICCDICKRYSHYSCVNIKPEEAALLFRMQQRSSHLKLLCVYCVEVFEAPPVSACEESASLELNPFLKYVRSIVTTEVSSIRNDLAQINKKINSKSDLPQPSYAQKVKNSSETCVIIKPKNAKQPILQTKAEVLQSIQPLATKIEISKVKTVSNGGLVIDCSDITNSDKLLNIAGDKLSQNYDIKKPSSILPRVRIVGFDQSIEKDDFLKYASVQNPSLFCSSSTFEIHKFGPTAKNNKIYQAEISVDLSTYKKLLDSGHLLIGLTSCTVYDAVSVLRCYKCSGYNHGSKQCKKQFVCPLCAGSHDVKNCPTSKDEGTRCCNNCSHLRTSQNLDIDINHAVWDLEQCFAYKHALSKLKNDVFNIPTTLTVNKLPAADVSVASTY